MSEWVLCQPHHSHGLCAFPKLFFKKCSTCSSVSTCRLPTPPGIDRFIIHCYFVFGVKQSFFKYIYILTVLCWSVFYKIEPKIIDGPLWFYFLWPVKGFIAIFKINGLDMIILDEKWLTIWFDSVQDMPYPSKVTKLCTFNV